jgi:hypothetical protein
MALLPSAEDGIVVGGVRIEGGQEKPTRAFDVVSGELLWERPGMWMYDGVAAIGDGALFALEVPSSIPPLRLVGYEIDSGEIRWEQLFNDPFNAGWAWHVIGQRLFTLLINAQMRSTVDGSLLWGTNYPIPPVGRPVRISSVLANDRTVFVSFSPVGSAGD